MSVSKPVQYPAPSGPYKVFTKGKNTWAGHSTARLQISIGNPKQDGVKLFAMAEWAAARFDKVIFIITDSIQRHNIALRHGVSMEAAHALALTEGHEWMARNKATIQSVPQRVVTVWDDWLSHPDYAATRQELDSLYHQNPALKEAVTQRAGQFCARHDQAALDISTEFLLEEVAAFAIMFKETPAADFYAGSWFGDIFTVIANISTSPLMRGFHAVTFVEVDFTKNNGRKIETV